MDTLSKVNKFKDLAAVDIAPGTVYTIEYPFRVGKFSTWDEDGPVEIDTWIPGCERVYFTEISAGSFPTSNSKFVAGGMGKMVVVVISKHQPCAGIQHRVFYTRKWVSPDGRWFGKKKVRVSTLTSFKRLLGGYGENYTLRGIGDE